MTLSRQTVPVEVVTWITSQVLPVIIVQLLAKMTALGTDARSVACSPDVIIEMKQLTFC